MRQNNSFAMFMKIEGTEFLSEGSVIDGKLFYCLLSGKKYLLIANIVSILECLLIKLSFSVDLYLLVLL